MIAVVDYGMGNLRSVINALEMLGAETQLVPSPAELNGADKLIIPGVGAFGDAMRQLDERGFTEALPERAKTGTPILGICLGMQLLATRGTEYGDHEGLGLIPGSVDQIKPEPGLRLPHVGWNSVEVRTPEPLLAVLDDEPTFYFVHSFEFVPDDPEAVSGVTDYGRPVTACVQRDNVFGMQFHPEKSQADGLRLLQSFIDLPC